MPFYIQRRPARNEIETIDEFDTYQEASRMCLEYNQADPTAWHYVSKRATKAWRERAA